MPRTRRRKSKASSTKARSKSPDADDCKDASSHQQGSSSDPSQQPRLVEPPRILHGFWKLPKELQHRILLIACTTDPLHRYDKVGREGDCTKTIIRLGQSCRYFYAFTTPLLFAHVRLERPSALRLFQQAVAIRPALGRLVRSLHIGPTEALPEYWWPIRNYNYSGKDNYGFRVHLVDDVDDPRRPWWACPTHDLHFDVEPDCTVRRAKAIAEAFEAASRDLDVDIRHENKDYSGSAIESDAWHVRIMEVQGAMELYAFHTGRRDAEEKEKKGLAGSAGWYKLKGSYARLVVSKSPVAPAAEERDGDGVLRVTRYDIYQRLARRRKPVDHFNHPLLFARSGLPWKAEGPNDVLHQSAGSHPARSLPNDPVDSFAWPRARLSRGEDDEGDISEAARTKVASDLSDPIDLAVPSTMTVGGNLALARAVLAFTPLLSTLSLTGFLQFATVSERASPEFHALRSVTLGPHTCWGRWLRYGHPTFDSVEKLRICGGSLALEEIDDIIGEDTLPNLREFYWSDVHAIADGDDEYLLSTIKRLAGLEEETAASGHDVDDAVEGRKRRKIAFEQLDNADLVRRGPNGQRGDEELSSSFSSSSRSRPKALYIEVHLQADEASTIIQEAPSREIAKAWCSGRAVAGQRHRLQLFRHAAALGLGSGLNWDTNLETEALFKEGSEFWEEEAGRG